MNYHATIKAGQINNLTNARFFASYQVDWIGFNLDPLSPASINPADVEAITNWLVLDNLMGEVNNRSVEEIMHLAETLKLRGVQVPYDMPSATFKAAGLTVIKTLSMAMSVLPMALDTNHIDWLLVEPNDLGWSALDTEQAAQLMQWIEELPVLLSVGPDEATALHVMDTYQPAGLNLIIPDEIRPGVQEFTTVLDVLDAFTKSDDLP